MKYLKLNNCLIYFFLVVFGCDFNKKVYKDNVYEFTLSEIPWEDELSKGSLSQVKQRLKLKNIKEFEIRLYEVYPEKKANYYNVDFSNNDEILLKYNGLLYESRTMGFDVVKSCMDNKYAEIDSMKIELEKLKLYDLKNQTLCVPADGIMYFIEFFYKGQYKLIYRWSPDICSVGENKEFVKIFKYILNFFSSECKEEVF